MNIKSLLTSCALASAGFALISTASADVIFDPSTPGLTFSGNPAFNATNGTSMYVYDGAATVTGFGLPAGNYNVSSLRTTGAGGTAFNVSLGGVNVIRDYALGGGGDETTTYLGYYVSPGTPTVAINGGGPSVARVKNLTFTATNSVYFDENTSGLSFGGASSLGSAGVPSGRQDSLLNAAGQNIVGIAPGGAGGSVSGSVSLTLGQTYQVTVSRQMALNSTDTGFWLSLGGSHFSWIDGLTTDANTGDAFQVNSFGFYTATSSSTSVLLDGAGGSFGRLDYVNFTAVPEPGTIGLIVLGFAGVAICSRRRKTAELS